MVNKMSSTDRERRNKGGSGVNDPSSWQVHIRKPCYDFSVLRVVNDKVQATCRREVTYDTYPARFRRTMIQSVGATGGVYKGLDVINAS